MHCRQHAVQLNRAREEFDAAGVGLANDLAAMTSRPSVAIIKHANPCGAAVADTLADAYQRAFECDERSAFGGIVALSHPVDDATVERMVAAAQADVVIAPGYDGGVVEALIAKRKNTRILTAPAPGEPGLALRQLNGAWLVQEPHHFSSAQDEWRVRPNLTVRSGVQVTKVLFEGDRAAEGLQLLRDAKSGRLLQARLARWADDLL